MKKLTKKVATLSLAGAILTAGGLVGCNPAEEYDVSNLGDRNCLVSSKDVYIVVSENGVDTLHKGDVVTYLWFSGGSDGLASLPTVLKLNCGEELQTEQFVAYLQGRPDKECYDEVCECALNKTLEGNHSCKNNNEASSILEDEREL